MKILHVISSLAMGGAETLAINLAAAQKALGHETAICCVMTPPEKGVLFKRASGWKKRNYCLGVPKLNNYS